MENENKLKNATEEEYGDQYKTHLLEQYKLYLEMADRISNRRQTTNSFFLTINTALIVGLGIFNIESNININIYMYSLFSLCGMVLCYIWYRIIRSYKDINSGKFKVIHEIENNLPISPYKAEWVCLGEGKDPKKYLPFTHVEIIVPWIFLTIYGTVILYHQLSKCFLGL